MNAKAPRKGGSVYDWGQQTARAINQNRPVRGTQMGNGLFPAEQGRGKDLRRNFQVVYGKVTTPSVGVDELLVYGGTWYTIDGTAYPLYDATVPGNKTSYFDFVSVTWAGETSGTYNLVLSRNASNCTLHVEEVGAYVGSYTDYIILATFTLDANGAVSTQLEENWKGGNYYSELPLDNISLNRNSTNDHQLYGFKTASSSGTPPDGGLIPYKHTSGDLRYTTFSELSALVDLDEVSINRNGSNLIQLYGFATASAFGTPTGTELFPAKDGSSLRYFQMSDIASYIDSYIEGLGKYWELGANKDACYGVSIGYQSGLVGTPSLRIDLNTRTLEGGVWNVSDTTAAASAAGCLKLSGGMYAADGIYVDSSASTYAGYFQKGNYEGHLCSTTYGVFGRYGLGNVVTRGKLGTASLGGDFEYVDSGALEQRNAYLCSSTYAGRFTDGTDTATLCDGTYAGSFTGNVNVDSGSAYHHGGVQGATLTTQFIKAVYEDGTHVKIKVRGGLVSLA